MNTTLNVDAPETVLLARKPEASSEPVVNEQPRVQAPTPPPPPATIAESGLHPEALAQLLLKTLIGGEASGSALSDRLKVPYSLLEALVQHARVEKLVEVRGRAVSAAPATATS